MTCSCPCSGRPHERRAPGDRLRHRPVADRPAAERPTIDLTLDACLAAVADAGLTPRDIDGLTSWPDHDVPFGFSGPRVGELHTLLRLDLSWILGCGDGANVTGVLGIAAHAVATGLARHVLVYRTVSEATGQGKGGRPAVR